MKKNYWIPTFGSLKGGAYAVDPTFYCRIHFYSKNKDLCKNLELNVLRLDGGFLVRKNNFFQNFLCNWCSNHNYLNKVCVVKKECLLCDHILIWKAYMMYDIFWIVILTSLFIKTDWEKYSYNINYMIRILKR